MGSLRLTAAADLERHAAAESGLEITTCPRAGAPIDIVTVAPDATMMGIL